MRRLLAICPALACSAVVAQDRPGKAVRIVVPFPPGGPTDVSARLLTDEMRAISVQAFVVDSRPGAAGALGIDHVAK
jgi:tripartite-type tricarboxylate transporter receptor subunit TctC